MSLNRVGEKTLKGWVLRALLGPAMIIDGLVAFVTVGTIATNLALRCARALAQTRLWS